MNSRRHHLVKGRMLGGTTLADHSSLVHRSDARSKVGDNGKRDFEYAPSLITLLTRQYYARRLLRHADTSKLPPTKYSNTLHVGRGFTLVEAYHVRYCIG